MEETYVNAEDMTYVDTKHSTIQTGPKTSERRFHGAVLVFLGLLSVFLLAGFIGLGVHYSVVINNLTEVLQDSNNNLSSMSEERDLLLANLTEITKEMEKLQSLSVHNSVIMNNLTEVLQDSNNKLSSVSEERDLLLANLTEITKEMEKLQSLSVHNSVIMNNLTEVLQDSNNNLSPVSEERDLLLANLTEITKEMEKLQSLSVHNSVVINNLTERLQDSNNKLSSMSEERDLLLANLTEITKEMEKLQSLSVQKKTCPAGWRMFRCSCYFLSSESGSWFTGRQDCREKGADLVVIDSTEEQTFLSTFTEVETWIGLTDKDEEGTWKWIDGTPLTLRYWTTKQPDNGGGDPQWGEEDCAHMWSGKKTGDNWNDRSCDASLRWICEKNAGV
ncbi:C-type lectin domain family 10 member A-like [Thunnus maccoyii]|uniref:C-type lectin domain family 10 member A-like n=1 Tax=Thunnus maccoyii TaxID=8240 RepID=UPI001C4D1805|nr:C-type lectin domain family 10 member A-like [Thunnus maccoyii]